MKKKAVDAPENVSDKESSPGYPLYPAGEDIFSNEKREHFDEDILPGMVSSKKIPSIDGDLDVPGGELDDADELIGEEDEENNYYSLGGDAHIDLDETDPERF